ncbi:MAG: helix-turn-helix transcriptional regulator [Ruminococcaceae bacterium]|nr:helix-turn-helix transcriptional regulator [Oscillospiraceae bacterium]
MSIGQKIRNAREDKDLSQYDMAKQIPMNQSNYSKIERDVQEPSIEQLRRICQILKLDPRYLLSLEEFEFLSAADLRLLADAKKFINEHQSNEKSSQQ